MEYKVIPKLLTRDRKLVTPFGIKYWAVLTVNFVMWYVKLKSVNSWNVLER
jgi:hypothetical protein